MVLVTPALVQYHGQNYNQQQRYKFITYTSFILPDFFGNCIFLKKDCQSLKKSRFQVLAVPPPAT